MKSNNNIFTFYWNVFSKVFKENDLIVYLGKNNLPLLSNGQKLISDAIITEKEIYKALKVARVVNIKLPFYGLILLWFDNTN